MKSYRYISVVCLVMLCFPVALKAHDEPGCACCGCWTNSWKAIGGILNGPVGTGLLLAGHTAVSITMAINLLDQATDIMNFRFIDNEDGVPPDEKDCGERCQIVSENLRQIRMQSVKNNYVGSIFLAFSALNNFIGLSILTAGLRHLSDPDTFKEYHDQALVFRPIALRTAAFASVLGLSTMVKLAFWELFERELPIHATAPVDKAVDSGLINVVPMVVHFFYGVTWIAKGIHVWYLKLNVDGVENAPDK